MAYKSYLTRQYEHTQENAFFRAFSTQLRRTFKDVEGLHILIGNVSCNGHQIDALFISSGKIIVIDFKNYGGSLTFSETNAWRISTGNDFVFVKGGGGIRNPYQQVNAYRHSLREFLSNKQSDFLEPNHTNFNLGHLSGLVLFHQPITFDTNEIPQNIRVYFDVSDNNHCIATISDRTSGQLKLSDSEIGKILLTLDIREENLYDEAQEPANLQLTDSIAKAERLELVRKTLANVTANSEVEKLIVYYQTLINLERQKEPSVNDEHPFHINWKSVTDSIKVNLENNPEFHQKFQQNASLQFPKNLFIGINVLFNAQTFPLLYNVIQARDILAHTNIESPIEDFTLYTKPLDDRNYPDELIEELTTAVNQKNTITEKTEILRNYLNGDVEIVENITLAFSEGNPFTSQLLAELKNITKEGLVTSESFLEKFLTKKPIPNRIEQIDSSEFIQITSLNDGQKEAVRHAFNQPLTVITGPPGTGKTQVVLNILANAVVQNKKVLLASKNNQAVDNVKDRLSTLIKEPNFFLRFGSKTEVREKTRPTIHAYVTRNHNNLLEDNSESISRIKTLIKATKAGITQAMSRIERRKKLETEIPEMEGSIVTKENEFKNWLASESQAFTVFSNQSIENLLGIVSRNNKAKNEIISKCSGIGRFIFHLTAKKKYAIDLVSSFESLHPDLKDFAIRKGIQPGLGNLKNGEAIIDIYNRLVKLIESGIGLIEKKATYERQIRKLKTHLQETENEIDNIRAIEDELQEKIIENQKIIENSGTPLVNELIHKRIRNGSAAEINKFKDYIPDNIPWRRQEIPEFVETTKSFLDTFCITAITSLSVRSAFPLAEDLFDMVVIDEASQCDIASALPLILRARQLVVIGDPMQLKHITKVQSYEEKYIKSTLALNDNLRLDYVNESLYDYCYNLSIISKSHSIFLKEHFRCHPQIIGYSNKAFYGPRMGQELDIMTSPEKYDIEPKGIFWINTLGEQHRERNVNSKEQKKAIELACKLAEEHKNISIGITTPFTHQAKEINDAIPQKLKERIKADTVHRFQGDEKDIMIVSLVVSSNSSKYKSEWINNKVPYLINVAVTRAKNTLYIIGNANYCRTLPKDSPLGLLVKYIDEINRIRN
jgi:superfamily I DNA and/or RNA helicase